MDLRWGLGFFKDWTNYLLVTTVAALGWVATKPVSGVPSSLLGWTIACFCLSVVFAILTLALIPLVSENCRSGTKSIYDVEVQCEPIPGVTLKRWRIPGVTLKRCKLKWVCWPQHVFFLAGIIFSVGSIIARPFDPGQFPG
jgi:hypothetical protein